MNKLSWFAMSSMVLMLGTAGKAQGFQLFSGPSQNMGNGSIYTWGTLEDDLSKPISVAVTFTASALDNLPMQEDDAPPGVWKGQLIDGSGNYTFEWEIPFPDQVKALTPFNHMGFNWNPHGHGPTNIYDHEHFDVHFYMLDPEKRHTILGTEPDVAAAPPSGFLPSTFFGPPGAAEPRMGQHWLDPTAPELQPPPNNQPFTQTWIYGTYQRDVIFWEPMIAKSFFTPGMNQSFSIVQPQYYEIGGYYPTTYNITHNATDDTYTVSLSNFVLQDATTVPEPSAVFGLIGLGLIEVGRRLLGKRNQI